MTWTGEEYLGFLRGLSRGTLLSASSRAQLHANQRGAAVVAASPIYASIGEDWAWGLGNWLECETATTPNSYNCGAGHRNSIARQGSLASGNEGVAIARTRSRFADGLEEPRLVRHREIHRARDEAVGVNLVVDRRGARQISARLDRDRRPQRRA